jgi:hypothetical protein
MALGVLDIIALLGFDCFALNFELYAAHRAALQHEKIMHCSKSQVKLNFAKNAAVQRQADSVVPKELFSLAYKEIRGSPSAAKAPV